MIVRDWWRPQGPLCRRFWFVDFDFVLALKLPALQIARFLVALECSRGDAHCTSHIPVCRKRASTVGGSEDPSYEQSICHGDSNIFLILKRSTYHQGRVVYIVFSSLCDLICDRLWSLLCTFDLHDPVLSTSVVLHDSYPFRIAAAGYRFFCNLRTRVCRVCS